MADAASERLRDHIRRLELDAERLRSQMSTGDLTNRCWARAEAARANVKQLHEKGKSTMQIRKHYLLVDLDLTEAEVLAIIRGGDGDGGCGECVNRAPPRLVRDVQGENSATEAWMKRAASRNLHVPWESKLHDFGPEAERLAQALTEPVLLARGWDFSQCASDPAVGKEGSATVLSSPESIGETSCLSLPQVHTTGSAPSAPPPPSAVAVAASTSPGGQDKRECVVGANGGQGQAYQAHCEGARKKGLPLLHRPLLFEPTLCLSLRCSCRSPDPSRAHARSD